MSGQILDALGLAPANQNRIVGRKSRPLTLEINLKPQSCTEVVPRTPKTPRSMLSPLTPKLKKPDWSHDVHQSPTCNFIDYDSDPSLALMILDLTSKLGQRLSHTLEGLVSAHAWIITTDYNKHCNQPIFSPDPDVRRLRSFEGRTLPIYRKRLCHRYVDREYFFKAFDRRERRKTLLAGGLNKKSRCLFRKMKRCAVVIKRLSASDVLFFQNKHVASSLTLLVRPLEPIVTLTRMEAEYNKELESDQDVAVTSETETYQPNESPRHCKASLKNQNVCEHQVLMVMTPRKEGESVVKETVHRKSVRRRSIPRRLLHII